MPTVSAAGVFGMLAGVLASIIESVGDYYACARIAGAPPPPRHAVNRGIGMEGIGVLLTGIWGCGSGTASYSENIGAIGITKVTHSCPKQNPFFGTWMETRLKIGPQCVHVWLTGVPYDIRPRDRRSTSRGQIK